METNNLNTNNLETIIYNLPAKKADLMVLILTSQGIQSQVEKVSKKYIVKVDPSQKEKAMTAIELYFKENRFFRLRQQIEELPLSTFKSYTAYAIMFLLWGIHLSITHYNIHDKIILVYGSSALYILQGETFRAVTALFLHADGKHLLGNMAGLLIFGAPLISLSGFGLGSFMLLFAGTTGNLINAYFYKTAHLSIGASTAVMGAAGLLVAYQVTSKDRPLKLNNLMPIFAGMILVGMFSQGENTDVWAHVFGFLAGLGSGIIFFPFNRTFYFPYKNLAALLITMLIIGVSILIGAK